MKLWIVWVLATLVAFGFGGRLGVGLSPSRDLIVVGFLAVAISLVLAGVLQWLVLRRLIGDNGSWVLASVGAVAAIGVLVFGLGLINGDVGWVAGVVIGWLVLGVLQWLVLRTQLDRAGWWVAAHVLGLIAAIPTVGVATWATGAEANSVLYGLVRWAAFGAAYGGVTGTALNWLLQQRPEIAVP